MKNKPYIYFYEKNYKQYKSLQEKISAFKIKAQDFIYGEIAQLHFYLEDLEKNGFNAYLRAFDDFDSNVLKEEEKEFYKCSMEFVELKELTEEFIKEGSQNPDHFDILEMVNKIFSYYPKDEYEKVCSMYHRLYKH